MSMPGNCLERTCTVSVKACHFVFVQIDDEHIAVCVRLGSRSENKVVAGDYLAL